MTYYTYILFSEKFNKYYIGQTMDLDHRLFMHNEYDHNSYTSKFRPWTLKTYLSSSSRSIAIKIEKYLKKKPRTYMQRVIDEPNLRKYIIDKYES